MSTSTSMTEETMMLPGEEQGAGGLFKLAGEEQTLV